MTEKDPEIKINLDEKIDLGESLENGFDAIGKVFGGLVGAIKDAVGPELMKTLEVGSWLGQVAECLEKISIGLKSDGTVPAEQAGQLSFYSGQFDNILGGSKLETQKAALLEHLSAAQQALENASSEPESSATTLAHAAGYFKAAAASCVPVGGSSPDNADG